MENSELNLLDEPLQKLVPASVWKRLVNHLIDVIIFSILIYVLALVLAPIYPLASKIANQKQQVADIDLVDQLVLSFFYGLYMSVLEAILKGKSLGKFVTGTRAVTPSGYSISANTAFARGLIRIIPMEPISIIFSMIAFATPIAWHDRWSGSIVIDEAKSILPPAE